MRPICFLDCSVRFIALFVWTHCLHWKIVIFQRFHHCGVCVCEVVGDRAPPHRRGRVWIIWDDIPRLAGPLSTLWVM